MNWLDRSDDKWMQQAFETHSRRARLKTLAANRAILFWLTIAVMIAYFGSLIAHAFSGRPSFDAAIIAVISTWMSYSNIDQELRMLRVVELLQPKSIESADTLPLRLDGSIRSEGTT